MKISKIVLILLLSTIATAQNLTISSSGQTGTSGTNWSIANNILTITGIADINVSAINGHLASNNLSFSGVVNMDVKAAISWSSNSNLTLNASQNILIFSDITASGSSPQLNIYYGGSNATTAPNSNYIYTLSQRNRNKISFTSSNSQLRIGNETFTIYNDLTQLAQAMSAATSSTRAALGANINLSQIYSSSLFAINFSGKLDGLGHVIDGLKIRNSGGTAVKADLGLFSQLQGATVRNLGITNVDILTNSSVANTTGSEFRIGALAGNIGNSSLTTTSYSASAYTSTIEAVWTSGNIGTDNNYSSDSQLSGDRQKFFFAGGLVGSINNGTTNISRCYSYANVSSSGSYSDNLAIGGLIGDVGKNISLPQHITGTSTDMILNLSKSFTTGSILSGNYGSYFGTGGVIGVLFTSGSSFSNCYSWGSAISNGSFGGLIGFAATGTGPISSSYTTQSTAGSNLSTSDVYTSVTPISPSTGTILPIGFSSSVWTKANGELPVLLDLETPPTILYVKVTTGQSSTCSALTVPITITDASGNLVTLSSLGLASPSGMGIFTINNFSAPGSYNAVSYLSGLTLTGANAANYTLNPYPETSATHTITGTCSNYQVTFIGNSNTSGTAPTNIIFSGSTTIPNQGTLIKSGSRFLGWNTAANGSGTSYAANATYSTSANITLYAHWVDLSTLGCVTVVTSGGAAENSTWVYAYNTIRPNSATAVSINASDIVSKLGIGNLTIAASCITVSSPISYTTNSKQLLFEASGNNIVNSTITLNGSITMNGAETQINENINTTTGGNSGDVLIKSSSDIIIAASKSISTNGGDVVLWANSDGQTSNGGVFFDAQTSITTIGGHVWIGGSSTSNGSSTWNGLTVGNGYAVSGRNLASFSTRTIYKVDWDTGILLNESVINSGGGNIFLGGQRNIRSNYDGGAGIINYNGVNGTTIDSGSGVIDIKAFGSHTANITLGFLTGLHPGETSGRLNIQSSNSNQTTAISIEVDNASTNNAGLLIEDETNIISSNSTNGGGISITGKTGGNSYGVWVQVGSLNILSASGKITLDGGTKGIGLSANGTFNNTSSQAISTTGHLFLGSKTGSAITSSTANIDILSDRIDNNTGSSVNVASSGQLNVFSKSTLFSQAFTSSQWVVSNNLTGLNIGKTTNTADVTFATAATISGPINVYGGSIVINDNLNTTAGNANGDVLLKSTADISLAASKSITTSGGDVILWANSDNEATNGSIALRNGSSVVTGSSTVAGGHIWIGGGSNGTTWNGLAVGSGYAVPGTSFTPSNGGGVYQPSGIYLERNSISSFGGNIKIAGDGAASGVGILTYGNTVAINAGSGRIDIDGQVTSTATGNRGGILFGLHDITIASTVNVSSSATTGDAITINGVGRGTDDAIGLSGTLNITSSGGGNIVMNGNALGTGRSIVAGNYYHGILNVFANSGTITLNGNTKAVQVAAAFTSGSTSGPSKINIGQGGTITSSSSDVFITADNIALAASGIAVNSSGKVTIESNADSFLSTLTFPITNLSLSSNVSGLTLGKSTNTANITLASATTIAGPISVYGGKIIANDLSVSTNDSIKLIASKDIEAASGVDLSTQGGSIILSSNSDGTSGGGILMTGSTIRSYGGNITLGGGIDGSDYAEGSADGALGQRYRGLWLDQTTIDAAGSTANGNIVIRGRGWQGANWLNPDTGDYAIGVDIVTSTIIKTAGSSTIVIDGIGGKNNKSSSHAVGVNLYNGSKIYTASGSLSLSGSAGTGLAREYAGILMDGGNPASIYSSSGNIEVTGNATSINQGIKFLGNVNLGWDGINVATSGAITLNADAMSFNSVLNVKTTGLLTVRPLGNSFSSTLSWPITNVSLASSISGLTIGKPTNTAAITFASPTTIAGPISAYSDAITLNANLTTTNNGSISLYTDSPIGLSSVRTLTAAGAFKYIPRVTTFTADVTYPIANLTATSTGLTIGKTTNDKNITVNQDVTGPFDIELYGNNVNINSNLTTSAINAIMYLKGNTTIAAGKSITSGGNFTHDGNLIFKSNATGTAAFGTLGGTFTTLSGGTSAVERYIPAKRAYRLLSSSVTTTTSIKDNWQENGVNTAGFGTHITGAGGATNGFDITTTNNPSLYSFENSTGNWAAVTNTSSNTLSAGTAYRLLVRGDRTISLATNTPTATVTTLRATGVLKTGNYSPTLNQASEGYSFVGNPYQAPVDIKAVLTASTNMNTGVVYYWDPTLNDRGAYVTRTLGTVNQNSPSSNFDQYLQPGQAVFVKKAATASAASLLFTESNKSLANSAAGVFRTTTTENFGTIRTNLRASMDNQWTTIEGALAVFSPTYSWEVTQDDANKFSNLDEEVSFMQNNTSLAIACQSNPSATNELPIRLNNTRHTNYQWQFELGNYTGATPYLFDTQNNTYTPIDNNTIVPFTVNGQELTRFKIVFQNGTLSNPDFSNQIALYPNPGASGATSFNLEGITDAQVTLFTLLGQNIPVRTSTNGKRTEVVSKTSLSKGVYLVRVTKDGKTAHVKWIVE
jgi:hypothetical protein